MGRGQAGREWLLLAVTVTATVTVTALVLGCPANEPTILEETPIAEDTSKPGDTPTAVSPDAAGPPDGAVTGGDAGAQSDVESAPCTVAADCVGKVFLKPCNKPACQDGECALVPSADNIPCDDGDPCFVSRTCSGGKCQGGETLPCDDGNPCTADGCENGACVHLPFAGGCDDGNPCTLADHCVGGACVSGNSVCLCDTAADCEKWQDENQCNGELVCVGGVCQVDVATVVVCEAGAAGPCEVLGCSPATGACGVVPVTDGTACTDSVVCTVGDQCVSGACQSGSAGCPCDSDESCLVFDDGNLCNGVMRCNVGQCEFDPSTVVTCEASNPCAAGACDPKTGQCAAEPTDGAPCDDNDPCTTADACTGGSCAGQAKSCDDLNPCTDDQCDASGACTQTPNNAPCDDGDECTKTDACEGGACKGFEDQCSCTKTADCLAFEDGDPCKGSLECVNGQCTPQPGSQLVCDSSQDNGCAKNTCTNGGCTLVATANGTPCFDGDPCTDGETCQGGVCGADLQGCSCQAGNGLKCGDVLVWANDAFGSTDNVDAWSCAPGDYTGNEYAFPFKVMQTSAVTVSLDDEEASTDLFVVKDEGAGCKPGSCLKAAVSKLKFVAEAGAVYYIVVDGKKGTAGKFTLDVACVTAVELNCEDGKDDDNDGAYDCDDDDCQDDLACLGGENCSNNVDDDDDMKVDCQDTDCLGTEFCTSVCYPEASAYCGLKTFWQTTSSTNNVSQYGSCAFQTFDGPDFFYTFNAVKSGQVTVKLPTSYAGHGLFVMQDQGGGCNGANCLSSGISQVSFFATQGVTYFLAIDGSNGAAGEYKIEIECP